MSSDISIQDIEPSVWNNITLFLYPHEQCKIPSLCTYLNNLPIKIPQHNFDNDIKYWQNNFKHFAEFGFADINVKDKLTTLNIDNGSFGAISTEEKLLLLYFLKFHTKIAPLYQPIVEQKLNEDIDDYAGDFYKEIKFLFSLNIGDNNDTETIQYIITYIDSMIIESKESNKKKSALLKEINLNGNDLNDNNILIFCENINNKLQNWNNLRKLELCDNNEITDKYMRLLFEKVIMEKCDGLDYLGLESTSIGDDTIDLVYEICEKYPKKIWIKHLNVQFNDNITKEGAAKITNDAFQERFPEIAKGMKISI